MAMPPAEARALALVPARAGSKGIPHKNTRLFAGRPLVQYSIEAGLGARCVERTVLSTDSAEIAELGRRLGAETPFLRPAELAGDDSPTLPVMLHALAWLDEHEGYRPDVVVLLQPTAPLRTARHVEEAVELLRDSGADSVVSVAVVPGHYHPEWQLAVNDGELRTLAGQPLRTLPPRRQILAPTYTRNGAIYACRRATLVEANGLYGDRCRPYVMPAEVSINLDSELDWRLAEMLLSQ
jgi:CMP-N-acetylneuraminic acid synthetase